MNSAARREGLLAIGYGSPLRGDDAAGPEAARRLAGLGFDAVEAHQLTPELAERIAAAGTVFFIDARKGVAPGEIAVERLGPLAGGVRSALEHYASPAALLRLAHEAYGAAPDAWLVSLGVDGFELGAPLSASAKRAIARGLEYILAYAIMK